MRYFFSGSDARDHVLVEVVKYKKLREKEIKIDLGENK